VVSKSLIKESVLCRGINIPYPKQERTNVDASRLEAMAVEAFDYAEFEVDAYSVDMDLFHFEYLEASRPVVQKSRLYCPW
jgi:hypothetical protein